jgi:hypothetical protein
MSEKGQPEKNRHRRTLSRSTSNSENVCGQAGTAGQYHDLISRFFCNRVYANHDHQRGQEIVKTE